MTAQVFSRPAVPAASPAAAPAALDVGAAPLLFHRTLPGYAVTRLLDCPTVAATLGAACLMVKDESLRLGLPSFKILGASWATVSAIRGAWLPAVEPVVPVLRAALSGSGRSLVAATDGNHGRGVARMAALLGLRSRILVPAGTASSRIDAIAGEGAVVDVIAGSYDDAVAASAALAGDDALVISDTSWPGYERVPAAVIDGYSTIFREADEQVRAAGLPPPTVVCLQAGVGSFAAAGIRHYLPTGARIVIVEPRTANCLMASAMAGAPTLVPGPHLSTMAGLNCGLPSVLAWPTIRDGVSSFVAIDDQDTYEAMRLLARLGVVAGESGAAGLAGLLAAAAGGQPLVTERDSVLVVNTEGATDPGNYAAVLGSAATG